MTLGAFLGVSQAFPRRYPRSQGMHSLLEDSSVERQCTAEYIAAPYVLHDVAHELVSRKNAQKCPQRRLSTPTSITRRFDPYLVL